MQSQDIRGKMLTVEDGYLVCPVCRSKRLLRISPATSAQRLPVYCRRCKREYLVDIDRGQCFRSPSR